jgi:pantothenate kinase
LVLGKKFGSHTHYVWATMSDLRIALDIGGTLAKVICVTDNRVLDDVCSRYASAVVVHEQLKAEEHKISATDLRISSLDHVQSDLQLALFCFDSRHISPLLQFLRDFMSYAELPASVRIPVTGGGAVKFRSELQEAVSGADIVKVDEMQAIAEGFSFLVRNPESAFVFDTKTREYHPVPKAEIDAPFPLLLVNVGSGVSIIKVDGPGEFGRVQGSPIGGGTVLGLGKVMIGVESFEEIMSLSMEGDSNKVDLSVGELLGQVFSQDEDEDSENVWNFNTVASSLAKLNTGTIDPQQHRADLAQSIVRMVSYNIGYLAYLVARLHRIERIYFSGKYVNKHIPTMDAISYAVKFYERWKPPPAAEGSVAPICELDAAVASPPVSPKNKFNVRFLHQEGFVGAIGALLSVYKLS